MRCTTKVSLGVNDPKKIFNPITGNYEVGSRITETLLANVNDLGSEKKNLLFGTLEVDAKTVRFNRKPKVAFDYLVIDGVEYNITSRRDLRRKMTVIVSEKP